MVRGLEPRRELVRQANRRDLLQIGHDLPGVLHGQPVRTILAGYLGRMQLDTRENLAAHAMSGAILRTRS